jgi:uncharacterized protein
MNINRNMPPRTEVHCGTHMTTITGRYINPRDLAMDDIDIDDIAEGLSKCCRFAGQCEGFYSVAQHSVHVADEVWLATQDIGLTRIALLHDAPEALLNDLVRCVKHDLRDYHDLEFYVWGRMLKKFQLNVNQANGLEYDLTDLPPAVREADFRMLVTERRDIIRNKTVRWDLQDHYQPYPWKIQQLEWKQAHTLFMSRFTAYFKLV